MNNIPTVLCFSGHDPTGGAGIIADSEAILVQGCHAVTVITALTQQNTKNVQQTLPVPIDFLQKEIDFLIQDISFSAIKVGLLGCVATAKWIGEFVSRHPLLPLVVDPIFWAGGGAMLGSSTLIEAYCKHLLPRTTVLTPNIREHEALISICAGEGSKERSLLPFSTGCKAILVTGADVNPSPSEIINTLHLPGKLPLTYTWPRLLHTYHGSGCTLAASIAAFLAQGHSIDTSVQKAQEYTYRTLQNAFPIGQGQWIPKRILKN